MSRIDINQLALEAIKYSIIAAASRVDKCIEMATAIADKNGMQGKELEIASMIVYQSNHIGTPEILDAKNRSN